MESRNYILRVSTLHPDPAELERELIAFAERLGAGLSVIVRDEHESYAMHVSRKTLVKGRS